MGARWGGGLAAMLALLAICGCGSNTVLPVGGGVGGGGTTGVTGAALNGTVRGAGQPVGGVSVQLFAAGTTGRGAGAIALGSAVTTGADGRFNIPAGYTCVSARTQLYLVARLENLAEIAVIGECSGSNQAAYVVDEATTVAGVWAMGAFISPDGTIGTTASNATGLANAAAVATALVSIADGHAPGTALPATATAPTAKLNTLANLLSLCAPASPSAACSALLAAATAGSGPAPADTLAAAVGLAHAPATGVAQLYPMANGVAVYSPSLPAAPPDWTLAMTYAGGGLIAPTAAGVAGPTALAINAAGNAWVANYGGVLSAFSPVGAPLFATGLTGGGMGNSYGLAIDPSGNVWVTNNDANSVTVWSGSGSLIGAYTTGGLNHPVGLAIAPGGDVWITNNGDATVTVLNGAGVPLSGAGGYGPGMMAFPDAVAIDAAGGAWVGNGSGPLITHISADGSQLVSVSCCDGAAGLAVDPTGAVWTANYFGDSVNRISAAGAVSGPYLAGSLAGPQGIAVDGAGAVWVSSFRSAGITELDGTSGAVLSPAAGWASDAGLNQAFALAIDAGGNVWVSNFAAGTVTEVLGVAAPVRTPLLGPVAQP